MRLPAAWTDISNENKYLKITTILLSLITIGLGVMSFKLIFKDPLLIERACATTTIGVAGSKATDEEVRSFVVESLKARFNTSGSGNFHLLSVNELKRRNKEQDSLIKQGIDQEIIISKNSFEVLEDKVLVKADRLIRLGDLRTAFLLNMSLKVSNTERSRINPYGLVLTDIKLIKPKVEE